MSTDHTSRVVVVMGVSGCGKSTVGRNLAEEIGAAFLDADDLHPAENVALMAAGTPLGDADREPWLDAVGRAAAELLAAGRPVVVACSALRQVYRDRLRAAAPTDFVHLDGARDLLVARVTARTDHFMPTSLLDSQLETLERLGDDESGVTLDVARSVPTLVEQALAWLSE